MRKYDFPFSMDCLIVVHTKVQSGVAFRFLYN